ncbi:MAG: hypothetical protein OXI87_13365 [Albidovulum sp.]|nr:hypothetical protein [Albidovulum sp.]MDE0534097.1 hypothetical protein [Albidovulum sp.]
MAAEWAVSLSESAEFVEEECSVGRQTVFTTQDFERNFSAPWKGAFS